MVIAIAGTACNTDNTVLLACPTCCNMQPATSHFQLKDLDKTAKCIKCNKANKIYKWTCKCQLPWHLCDVHQHCSTCYTNNSADNISEPSKKRSCDSTNTSPKRSITTLTHDQLLAYDNKRARLDWRRKLAKQDPAAGHFAQGEIRPLQPSFLSQRLKERFAHLFA